MTFLLEIGFTLLFILKKWYENIAEVECIFYVLFKDKKAPLHKKLLTLTDQVLQSSEEDVMISGATTFFTDLVLGFVFLCKSISI